MSGPAADCATRRDWRRSPASMWESVLASNRDEVRPLLKELAATLDAFADQLDDPAAINALFTAAARAKSSCL